MGRVYVTGPRDRAAVRPPRQGVQWVNTTSHGASWERDLSPFTLGPCPLYAGAVVDQSATLENLWQYAKLYAEHADADGEPTEAYYEWAGRGWLSPRAVRYPMGKGAKPLCSLWSGRRLSYVEARLAIYVPQYAAAVAKTAGWRRLQELHSHGDVALWDFDGYTSDRSFRECAADESRPLGHAFVLAAMLTGELDAELMTRAVQEAATGGT